MHRLMGITMLLQGSGQGVLAAATLTWDAKQMLVCHGNSMDQDDNMGLIGTALAPQLSEGGSPCQQSLRLIKAALALQPSEGRSACPQSMGCIATAMLQLYLKRGPPISLMLRLHLMLGWHPLLAQPNTSSLALCGALPAPEASDVPHSGPVLHSGVLHMDC